MLPTHCMQSEKKLETEHLTGLKWNEINYQRVVTTSGKQDPDQSATVYLRFYSDLYSLLAGQCNLCFMYVWIFEIVKLRLILPLYWLSFQFCLKNIAQQGILFGRSYISEEYLQNLKETVQSNNLSQSFVKIQCMHLKCWGKNQTFQGCSGLLLHWKYCMLK